MNERSIFMQALEKGTSQDRSAYLDQACGGDSALRQRVEALLASHIAAGSFLGRPVSERLAEHLAAGGTTDATYWTQPAIDDSQSLAFLTPSDKPDSLGRLGHYEVQQVIGRGGMGIVLRAFDEKLHRVVAIKVMNAALAANEHARRRFLREGRAAAAIRDDHVIGIHGVDETGGLPFLVMEYIVGRSLAERLESEGPLPVADTLRIGGQIARGLAAAHAQGLVHRDIKPANILLENGVERVKITDFGLAHAVDDVRATQPGVVLGTPEFMSPEQARGEKVDYRSDLFSLGCVLYAMCAGRPPFRADSTVAIIRRVCEDTPRPLSEINPDIPAWLAELIDRLIAKDPASRFQSAAEVAELLSQCLAHIQETRGVGVPPAIESLSLWERVAAKPPGEGPVSCPLSPASSAPNSARVPGVERSSTPASRRHWALAAAIIVLLGVGLTLAESTGVTAFTATVIRIVRGDGTLVVEVDDPNIQVLIDGEELILTGAGPKEIRLRPGKHELQTVKDGKATDTKLVTITKGGRDVVKVRREQSRQSGAAARQVWANATDSIGSISADGRHLAYTDWETGDIAIRDLTSGTSRRVTNKGTWAQSSDNAMHPKLSPDGMLVAYTYISIGSSKQARQVEIRVSPATGGDAKVLFSDPQNFMETLGWMPDKKSIVTFLYAKTESKFVEISVEDSSQRLITSTKWSRGKVGGAALSPNGRFIAYSRVADTASSNRDIYLIDCASGQEVRLTGNIANEDVLAWALDSEHLLVDIAGRGTHDAWMLRMVNGKLLGEPRLVKPDLGVVSAQGFSRDGTFYYAVISGGPSILVAKLDPQGRVAAASKLVAENPEHASLSAGDWSPDGQYLAYRAVVRGRQQDELRIAPVDGGDGRVLLPELNFTRCTMRWSPDARSLLVVAQQAPTKSGIYRVDVHTGDVTTIIEPTEDGAYVFAGARWSSDGRGIFYHSKSKQAVVYHDLMTDEEAELFNPAQLGFADGQSFTFELSPDGREIAVYGKDKSADAVVIRIVPRNGGPSSREVASADDRRTFDWSLGWTGDGKFLVFHRIAKNEAGRGLWIVPTTADGPSKMEKVEFTGIRPEVLQNSVMRPPTNQLALTTFTRRNYDIWALENFLPPLDDPKPAPAAAAAAAPAKPPSPPAPAIPVPAPAENADAVLKPSNQSSPIVRRVWDKAPRTHLLGGISPDGKYLAYGEEKDFGPQLAIRHLETGKTQPIGEISGIYSPLGIFAPDGKQMSYRWRNEQRIGEFDDQPSRTLLAASEKQVMAASLPQWSAGGKQILEALYYPARKTVEITLISVPEGTPRVLKTIDHHPNRAPTVAMPASGEYVAYSLAPAADASNRDIFLVSTGGSGRTWPLIEHPADDYVVAWTSGDQRLLFASDRSGSVGLWSVRVEHGKVQGQPELLKPNMGQFTSLGLTAAASLYYAVAARRTDVFTATLDPRTGKLIGEPAIGIRTSEGSNTTPAWSPDGRYLACRSTLSRPTDHSYGSALLCIRDTQTDSIRRLEPKLKRMHHWSLRWAPDQQSLLVIGSEVDTRAGAVNDRAGAYRLDLSTGETTLLAGRDSKTGEGITAAEWSADGKAIFMVRDAIGATGSKAPRRIVRRDLATGQEKELLQVPGYVFWMPISPFGNELAFVVGGKLHTLPVSGGEPRLLCDADSACGIAWTPDGRHLLFGRKSSSGAEICRISSTGGEPESTGLTLASSIGTGWFPDIQMHPDGKQIAFANRSDDASEVWALENFLLPPNDSAAKTDANEKRSTDE